MKFFVPIVIVGDEDFAFAVPPKTIGIANATAKAALTARRACLRITSSPFWRVRRWTLMAQSPVTNGRDRTFRVRLSRPATANASAETQSEAATTPDSR